MFEDDDASLRKPARDPKVRAMETVEEFRMHAELAAVFEATRKFGAAIRADLTPAVAKDLQTTLARLDKARSTTGQVIPPVPIATPPTPPAATPPSDPPPPPATEEAQRLLDLPGSTGLSWGDYHLCRRPDEVMIARWLEGEEIDTFYNRLQAHFDTALEGHKDDERQENAWKNDPATVAYLEHLDATSLNLAEVYIRPNVQKNGWSALNTQTADELNIQFLADYVMNVAPSDIVGEESAPPEGATDTELAWYFKLFLLRGMVSGSERTLFFAFLQKSDGDW